MVMMLMAREYDSQNIIPLKISLVSSLMFDQDAGRKTYVEELYEQEDRNFPGGAWKAAKVPWTNVVSHAILYSLFVTHAKDFSEKTCNPIKIVINFANVFLNRVVTRLRPGRESSVPPDGTGLPNGKWTPIEP